MKKDLIWQEIILRYFWTIANLFDQLKCYPIISNISNNFYTKTEVYFLISFLCFKKVSTKRFVSKLIFVFLLQDHRGSPLTLLRSNIMKELLKLATGDYRDIRILGQNYFHDALSNLQFTYRAFVDDIVDALEASKDSKELAAKMKGSLYLILGGKSGSLILKHDWLALSKVSRRWLSLVHPVEVCQKWSSWVECFITLRLSYTLQFN